MSDYKDTFKSTAVYYSRYRDTYPDEFFRLLKERFWLSADDRALDLGCGTGQIAIPLAALTGEVIAMDPEPEMIAEGEKQAEVAGVKNISWLNGGSDDLEAIPEELRSFKLVTIGSAFHWMDREIVLRDLYEVIQNGGGIVIAGNSSIATETGTEWQDAVKSLITRYLGERRRAGSGYFEVEPRRHEDFLQESRFSDVEIITIFWARSFSVEELAGYYFSTSMVNPSILGDRTELFERELKQVLNDYFPSGKIEYEGKTEVIFGRKDN